MTSTTTDLLGLPPRLGRFEPRRLLGRGGMGRVVLAHDPLLKRDVALKLVEPTAVDPADLGELRYMFHREARATAALRHPNIVEIYDYSGPEADLVYIICELIIGPTLREVLDEHGRLGTPILAALGYELAQALAHAHAHGIIHRDIKPENIFWTAAGRVVIGDFGIAKAFDGSARLGGTVQFGATNLYGSPAYMAPEQLLGGEVGPKTDLFAFGSSLFECFTGVPAFDGPDLESIIEAVKQGQRQLIPAGLRTTPRLRALFDRMLATAPAGRPPSALAVAEELRELLDELGIGDPRRALRLEGSRPVTGATSDGGGDWIKRTPVAAEEKRPGDLAGTPDAATVIDLATAREHTKTGATTARGGATAIVPEHAHTRPAALETAPAGSASARRMTLIIGLPVSAVAIAALGFLGLRLLGYPGQANPPLTTTTAPTVAVSQAAREGATTPPASLGAATTARGLPVGAAAAPAPIVVTLAYAGDGEIWVDGSRAFAGAGPARLSLLPGRHRVELRRREGSSARDVLVVAGTAPQFDL